MVNYLTPNFVLAQDVDANKMYVSYDFFDKKTFKSLKTKHDLKKKPNEYKKYKIYHNPQYNLKYYQGAARQIITHYKLLEVPSYEMFIEYLTKDGWISEFHLSRNLNQILAIPTNDKGLPSGFINSALTSNSIIYGIRLNVFKKTHA